MATTMKIKRSAVASKVPTTADLDLGELAVNTYDGKLFMKKDDGTAVVVEIGPVKSVAGQTGVVTLTKTDVGLANVDNTSDASKPISTATQTALDGKAATSHTHTSTQISDGTVAGRALLTAADAAAQRTSMGLGNALKSDTTAIITKGYTVTPNSLGTIAGFTLDPTLGNYQYGTNNGAFTLTAPTSDCAVDVLITNGASAGTITFSGFTVGSSTGSALTTTSGHKFIISIRRINAVATYSIYALQ